jgi:hypothetical protein
VGIAGIWSCPIITSVYTPYVYKGAGIAGIWNYIIYTDLIFMRYRSCEPSELIMSSLRTLDLLRNSTPKINRNFESSCPAAEWSKRKSFRRWHFGIYNFEFDRHFHVIVRYRNVAWEKVQQFIEKKKQLLIQGG